MENVDFIKATKIEAAFELNYDRIINDGCSKYGKKKVWPIEIRNSLKIDDELLTVWAENMNIYFVNKMEI